MVNDLPIQYQNDEFELDAFNNAFYELGFRWYWDRDTYFSLIRRTESAADQIRFYLQTRQPHLLTAYDATFLVELIQQKKAEHCKRARAPASRMPSYFDWSQTPDRYLGA